MVGFGEYVLNKLDGEHLAGILALRLYYLAEATRPYELNQVIAILNVSPNFWKVQLLELLHFENIDGLMLIRIK